MLHLHDVRHTDLRCSGHCFNMCLSKVCVCQCVCAYTPSLNVCVSACVCVYTLLNVCIVCVPPHALTTITAVRVPYSKHKCRDFSCPEVLVVTQFLFSSLFFYHYFSFQFVFVGGFRHKRINRFFFLSLLATVLNMSTAHAGARIMWTICTHECICAYIYKHIDKVIVLRLFSCYIKLTCGYFNFSLCCAVFILNTHIMLWFIHPHPFIFFFHLLYPLIIGRLPFSHEGN